MSYARLRLEPIDDNPFRFKIYLNDISIGKYVQAISIEADALKRTGVVANIRMIVKPEIPEDLIAFTEFEVEDPLGLLADFKRNKE